MDPITILTALLPAVGDMGRMLMNKFTGGAGAKPANVDEVIKLKQAERDDKDADVRRLEALAKIDNATNVHSWVNDVRAMQRPVVVASVLLSWIAVTAVPGADTGTVVMVSNMASAVFFYLFGERAYMYTKK